MKVIRRRRLQRFYQGAVGVGLVGLGCYFWSLKANPDVLMAAGYVVTLVAAVVVLALGAAFTVLAWRNILIK